MGGPTLGRPFYNFAYVRHLSVVWHQPSGIPIELQELRRAIARAG